MNQSDSPQRGNFPDPNVEWPPPYPPDPQVPDRATMSNRPTSVQDFGVTADGDRAVGRVQTAAVATLGTTGWGDQGAFKPVTFGKQSKAAEATWHLSTEDMVPDTILDAGRLGGLEIRAASTRGPSHRCDGSLRQDAIGVLAINDKYLVAAVADGVGSVPDSHRGATLAVKHSIHFVRWAIERHGFAGIDLGAAVDAADREVQQAGPRPEDRATTLTVVVMSSDPEDGYSEYRVTRVGDSPAFVLENGQFRPLFDSRSSDMHETTTESIPGGGAKEIQAGHLGPGEALVIASDGLGTPLLFPEPRDYLAKAWREPPGPIEFLQQLQFRARTFDDDRSAVVVWAPRTAREQ